MPRIYARKPIEYVVSESGCHTCTSHFKDRDGYPVITIKQKDHRLSRYIWMQERGEIPNGYVIRHTCDNRACINPNHLTVGTQRDNMRDMVARGRSTAGERHPRAKLTAKDVGAIRSSNESHTALGRKYGVTRATIHKIRNGINWRT